MEAQIIFKDLSDPDQQFDHACCIAGKEAVLTIFRIRELLRNKAKYSNMEVKIYAELHEDVMDCVPEVVYELMNRNQLNH